MAAVSSDSAVAAENLSVCAIAAQPVSRSRGAEAVVIPIIFAVEVAWLGVLGYAIWAIA